MNSYNNHKIKSDQTRSAGIPARHSVKRFADITWQPYWNRWNAETHLNLVRINYLCFRVSTRIKSTVHSSKKLSWEDFEMTTSLDVPSCCESVRVLYDSQGNILEYTVDIFCLTCEVRNMITYERIEMILSRFYSATNVISKNTATMRFWMRTIPGR